MTNGVPWVCQLTASHAPTLSFVSQLKRCPPEVVKGYKCCPHQKRKQNGKSYLRCLSLHLAFHFYGFTHSHKLIIRRHKSLKQTLQAYTSVNGEGFDGTIKEQCKREISNSKSFTYTKKKIKVFIVNNNIPILLVINYYNVWGCTYKRHMEHIVP